MYRIIALVFEVLYYIVFLLVMVAIPPMLVVGVMRLSGASAASDSSLTNAIFVIGIIVMTIFLSCIKMFTAKNLDIKI